MRFITPLLTFFLLLHSTAASAPPSSSSPASHLVRTSCQHASYPSLCLHTLSSSSASSPRDLALAAVSLSLSRARSLSSFLSNLSHPSSSSSPPPRQRVALTDCVEQVSDSVDELARTLEELHHLHEETFLWQMSNAQTWVSAALTNDDTCLDGFAEVEGEVKAGVRRKIVNAARVTSNALYLINRLDDRRGRPGSNY